MPTLQWLEDFHRGDRWRSSAPIMVTRQAILDFALHYDPQAMHLGAASVLAPDDQSDDLMIASGWQTAAWTMRLLVDLGLDGPVGRHIDLDWPSPTCPGDALSLELSVTAARASRSTPGRGVVELDYLTRNQHGDIRQRTHAVVVAWARPDGLVA
ncbi:MAG: hypothetical protein LBV30_05580 [Propionibacteriaceae bacterium]|jgi:acyl dehydratase|nr:hypothetical protein [Propionibacteriaceae bacterium]